MIHQNHLNGRWLNGVNRKRELLMLSMETISNADTKQRTFAELSFNR